MLINKRLLFKKEKKCVIRDIINTLSLRSIFSNGCTGPENCEQIPLLISHEEYLSHCLESMNTKQNHTF